MNSNTPSPASNVSDSLDLQFRILLYEPADIRSNLPGKIDGVAEALGRPELRGPLFALVQELAANALKALYKRIYEQFMIRELGLEDIEYEKWMQVFRTEVDSNSAENFAALARERNFFASVTGELLSDVYRFEVRNPGEPSEVENKRIEAALRRARETTSSGLGFIFSDTEGADSQQEGGGLGIPLLITTLRGLGAGADALSIAGENGQTTARIDFPREIFAHRQSEPIARIARNRRLLAAIWNLNRELDHGFVRFSADGALLEVSDALLEQLEISSEDIQRLGELLPVRFFGDVFRSVRNVRTTGRFENYRLWLRTNSGQEALYNVSGYLTRAGFVDTIWQRVVVENAGGRLLEGSIMESLEVQKLITPYIPPQIMNKAREVVRQGKDRLPDEVRDITILFADMVGFTQKAERMEPHKLVDFLNLALGAAVRSVEKHDGAVEKFMGDAVMAMFRNPHGAVIAAMEIQRSFAQMNEFRRHAGEPEVEARIGIHSGKVIVGNIGYASRMDWTAIGDTVNTASRIEQHSKPGQVLISEDTYERIRDYVETSERFLIRVKGKRQELPVYFVESVEYDSGAGAPLKLRRLPG